MPYNTYFNNNPYFTYPQQSQNQPIQPTNFNNQFTYSSPNDYPILKVQFATEAEVNAFMPPPNTRIMFMDRNNNVFWIKWADSMGTAGIEKFEFWRAGENEKKESNFITEDRLKEVQNELKKDIDILRKEVNIKKIIQEDK